MAILLVGEGFEVEDPLVEALSSAIEERITQVVEVPVIEYMAGEKPLPKLDARGHRSIVYLLLHADVVFDIMVAYPDRLHYVAGLRFEDGAPAIKLYPLTTRSIANIGPLQI